MSEPNLKESFGNLGLYLVEKAQKEIRELHQKTLFQKADIKMRFIDKKNESSMRIRKLFIESYNRMTNEFMSSTLLKGKETFLNFKNKLILDLKSSLQSLIKEKINKNYSKYKNFLIKNIQDIRNFVDRPHKIELLFNLKDYGYFNKNSEELNKLFKNPIEIKKDQEEFIGGFKVLLDNGLICYDYKIGVLIDKISTNIQMEISKIVNDKEIKALESQFEEYCQNKKLKIAGILKDYDQI